MNDTVSTEPLVGGLEGVLLDRARVGWEQLVAWSFLVRLRPVWWVLRAWLAVQLLDLYLDPSPATLVPARPVLARGPGRIGRWRRCAGSLARLPVRMTVRVAARTPRAHRRAAECCRRTAADRECPGEQAPARRATT